MIRMTKLTDYGIVLLTLFARGGREKVSKAKDLAQASSLPLPTVSKVLKLLAHQGLLVSHRGINGGYSLSRSPEEISMVEIIDLLEGPITITECSDHSPDECAQEGICPVREHWNRINGAIRGALEKITLSEMALPLKIVHPIAVAKPQFHQRRCSCSTTQCEEFHSLNVAEESQCGVEKRSREGGFSTRPAASLEEERVRTLSCSSEAFCSCSGEASRSSSSERSESRTAPCDSACGGDFVEAERAGGERSRTVEMS